MTSDRRRRGALAVAGGWGQPLCVVLGRTADRASSVRSQRRRAGHTGPADSAITIGVFRQILLVVVLGEIERLSIGDFRRDLSVSRTSELRLVLGARCQRARTLTRVEHLDDAAVLRSDVVALTHSLGGIVVLPERREQLVVWNDIRIEDDENDLGVTRHAATHLPIRRVDDGSA